jgi:hypothetical protein
MTTISGESGREVLLAEVKQSVGKIMGQVFERQISVVSEVPLSDTVQ